MLGGWGEGDEDALWKGGYLRKTGFVCQSSANKTVAPH